MEPEYKKWDNFLALLSDKRAPIKVKKNLIKLSPNLMILSLEEIAQNFQEFTFPVSEELRRKALQGRYKNFIKRLASTRLPVRSKRKLLTSKIGLQFLETILPEILLSIKYSKNGE